MDALDMFVEGQRRFYEEPNEGKLLGEVQAQVVDEELARLREESMQQAKLISELREEINAQDGEIKRLREENSRHLETIALLREENRRWLEWSESKGPGLDAYREMGARLEKAERERDEAREALHTAEVALKMVSAHMSPYQPVIAQAVREAIEEIGTETKPDAGTHMDPGEWLPEFNPIGETK